nr:putative GDP-fucose protein O-fucosyltransferase [Tanacetum cinerariifolium]
IPSSERLKAEGLCPLMPEETVLMLAGLGFKRETRILLAGSHIYGGKSRLNALMTLFPNMVTKEDLLSSSEIQPFLNYSSQ